MKTRGIQWKATLGLSLPLIAAAACATTNLTATGVDSSPALGVTVEVVAEGGFAALSVKHRVEHDSRAFAVVQRRMCTDTCAAPMDTASGILSPARTDSLFRAVLMEAGALPRDDYGTTRNAADMMLYTIRLTADGRVRTIRGDDGTLPEAARHIMAAVRGAIAAARAR